MMFRSRLTPEQKAIARLKTTAADAHRRYRAISDDIDCGNTILQMISAAASEAAREFDAAMEELEKLDPSCPRNKRLSA